MKFSIITPTYKRAEGLLRAVKSVQSQTYTDWEMIIVNDSPTDDSYNSFVSSINDARIHYHINEVNRGVNFTRNYALDKVSADSKWVIFLDDDDYFAPDCLATFVELIREHPRNNWFVTNRAYKNGESITKFPKDNREYSYVRDYLILKRCKGDVTHSIATAKIHNDRFPKNIKQGEEWLFFYQLGLKERMFYYDHNSTITDGYSSESGLNFRKRSRVERLEDISILFYEGARLSLAYRPSFILYLIIRILGLVKLVK